MAFRGKVPRVEFGPASTPEYRNALFADTGLSMVSQLVRRRRAESRIACM